MNGVDASELLSKQIEDLADELRFNCWSGNTKHIMWKDLNKASRHLWRKKARAILCKQ